MAPASFLRGNWRLALAVVISAALLAALAFAAGRFGVASAEREPSTTSAEAGFARDMQVHHQQAVELSMIVRDNTQNADVRLLAYDIALTQSQQAGQLYGWLAQWGVSQAGTEPAMTWMSRPPLDGSSAGHEHGTAPLHQPGSAMPGMATAQQLASLAAATGVDAERQFLTLMIAHHRGGVDMALALLERSDDAVVAGFARSIVTAQLAEIEAMTAMLEARG